jgi:hypothetical protein
MLMQMMGKPTSDEMLKLEKLKEFQKANPGLDFVSVVMAKLMQSNAKML